MNWSARRINKIKSINEASTYLEVGVEFGETFFDVEIAAKDGVDPEFQFDVAERSSDRVRFFQETSDAFWTSDHPEPRYDVIMLDGLHTFEQTFRDLIASMRHAHARTVWVIDDTVPLDVFSAIPNQKRSFAERKKAGLEGLPWHGDVFKIVPAIFNFVPTLNYATIIGSDNPQTIAWYGKRFQFKAQGYNLEGVTRLTFFDMERMKPIFNFLSEDEALAQLARGLRSQTWI